MDATQNLKYHNSRPDPSSLLGDRRCGRVAREKSLPVFSDDIYYGFNYEERSTDGIQASSADVL